ncbi:hypothetical protein [Sulfurovum sp. NBC37-1]|uniref:hypothetical protein n=1 Tax=Sulfurovum sp. (strain NBC37-1) TaxID=387093 RepID=UPI0001587994|nr:hypothetical protein [Sulfurovum sp. NBC37-1]BAF72381.1 conserved hypothetical protein [Sulfurovum sp. NBC37-1]
MKKISIVFAGLFLIMGVSFASTANNQIFSVDNANGKINAKSVEKAFNENGMHVDVNNDMNSIFKKRYKKVHHKSYNLAIFRNNKSVAKLIKKYPSIGLITPLSMSIYSDDEKNTINISTLSLKGMARITKIPKTDPDLVAYAKLLDAALHKALPNGSYLKKSDSAKSSDKALTTDFTTEFELEDGMTYTDAKESFEEEFEGEIGPVGFLVPKKYDLQKEVLKGKGDYDFYDTYSIIRFNVIFPVSKNHPDAGSYAPFSLAIYKKKSEGTVHISYPSIDNWIDDLGITDKDAITEVKKTQKMLSEILTELTE